MKRKLFGTDGIRGRANIFPMTPENIVLVGRAAAYKFSVSNKRCKIIIGKDTRLSCYMIETALASGISSMGVDVLLIGPMPTPGVAFLTSNMRCDAGVMISASHNPYDDNGIKFFSSEGLKLSDKDEAEIEQIIEGNHIGDNRPTAKAVGKIKRIDDAAGRYIVFAKNSFPKQDNLEGLKLVVDCSNGSAYNVAPTIFRELDADEVIAINNEPDGRNINRQCGALYPDKMANIVKEHNADIGIALDGDSDRVILCDKSGSIVDGDKIMGVCAKFMKEKGQLKRNTVVATSMSNFGLEKFLNDNGISLVRTDVGDRYVIEEMIKGDYNLGGEQSGHIIFRDHNFTGDGIVSALQIMSIMKSEKKDLKTLTAPIKPVPQRLENIKVKVKKNLSEIPSYTKTKMEADAKLKGIGFAVVRYSGTENLARVMVQSLDDKITKECTEVLSNTIRSDIGEDA